MISKNKAIVAHSLMNEWKQVCAHQGKKGTRSHLFQTLMYIVFVLVAIYGDFILTTYALPPPSRGRPPAPARVKLGVGQAGSYVRRALTGKCPLRFLGEKFHP